MKRVPVILLFLALLLILPISMARPVSAYPSPLVTPTPPLEPEKEEREQVEQAILNTVAKQRGEALGPLVYQVKVDNLVLSSDQTWAVAWVILADPQSGEILPVEPALAVAQWSGKAWLVTLPSDPGWAEALERLPEEVLPPEKKEEWLRMNEVRKENVPTAPLRGYLLPWAAGQQVRLTRSTAHDSSFPTGNAHYSFDFANGTMFSIYAAKAGTVWLARDDVPNNNHNEVNYLVLQDATTTPTTYQLYMHLAQGSIPPALKVIGTPVVQGQFIGIVDNTGSSTGHHLHFQVETNPYWIYWGVSVDIIFGDVSINGGRPRNNTPGIDDFKYCTRSGDVCVTSQVSYVSGNVPAGDIYLPDGGLTSPANGILIQAPSVQFSGWADDAGSGLYSAQFRANFNDTWHDIGPVFNASSFSYTWDMCAAGVPDGPVSVAVHAVDKDGNQNFLADLRHFSKKFPCAPPPPACSPGRNQVALFTRRNYEGACMIYKVGDYANLDSLGDNTAASIQVGENVKATLFMQANFQGRGETFLGNDINFSNNPVTIYTASSLKVQSRTSAPAVPLPIWPMDGQAVTKFDSLGFSWQNAGGATVFQSRYMRRTSPVETVVSGELAQTYWNLGPLPPGTYAWQMRAFAPGSSWSEWSAERIFTVEDSSPSTPPTRAAPFTDNMENGANGWISSGAGLWHLEDGPAPVEANSGSHYWWFGASSNGSPNYDTLLPSDLTSPPISIPANARYYLRFWYRYQTETIRTFWDQRWIQASVDGGPFANLLQLSEDPLDYWLRSPDIDLSAYSGHTLRVRFHFQTMDPSYNNYQGWYIDDVSITADPPPACTDSLEPNNTPGEAASIVYGQTMTGTGICPAGDVDIYQFTGNAGDRAVIDIDAQVNGSKLDAVVTVLDSDGVNALAEHDDEIYGERKDPHLGFLLPHSGVFYIKVSAWNHPGAGGTDYGYSLRLVTDSTDPVASLTRPASGSHLTGDPVNIQAQASDSGSGISHVEFLMHSSEWSNTAWVGLGSDWDGSDGWTFAYSPASQPDQNQMAFYIRAYDWAGNWSGAGAWNLGLDRTPPITSILPLPTPQNSTAFKVEWTGVDFYSGIDHYDLQWKVGSGSWQDYQQNLPASTRSTWVVGQLGQTYAFRMRGVDRLGNAESYPSVAETTTSIPNNVCSSPDVYEAPGNDNSPAVSTPLSLGESQVHNFCNPVSTTNGLNDEDWLVIPVRSGRHYRFLAFPQVSSAAAILSLYDQDGATLLADASAVGFGDYSSLEWTAQQDRLVFLRVRPIDGRVAGNPVNTLITFLEGYQLLLPLIRE